MTRLKRPPAGAFPAGPGPMRSCRGKRILRPTIGPPEAWALCRGQSGKRQAQELRDSCARTGTLSKDPPGGGRNSGAHGDVREEWHVHRDRARGRRRAFRGGGRVGTGTGRGAGKACARFSGHAGLESFQADVPPPGTGSEDRAYAAPAVVSSEQPSRQGGRLRGGVSGSLRGLAQSPGPRAARHRSPRSVCVDHPASLCR